MSIGHVFHEKQTKADKFYKKKTELNNIFSINTVSSIPRHLHIIANKKTLEREIHVDILRKKI